MGSNDLSGAIPTQLGSLTALTDLYLGGNWLTGSVPTQIGAITTLTTLSICNNQLTGDLPSALRTGVTLLGYPTADGYTPIACQNAVSDITYDAPSALVIGRNFTLEIDVLDYITEDSSYTVTCGDADVAEPNKFTGITHSGSSCTFTVDPVDTLASGLQGSTTFSVLVSSSGGTTTTATFTIEIGPDSNITVSPPSSIAIAAGRSRTVDFSSYATDAGGYTISCATPTTSSTLITISTPTGCSVVITSGSTMGTATVSVVFTSAGGDTATGSCSRHQKHNLKH